MLRRGRGGIRNRILLYNLALVLLVAGGLLLFLANGADQR